MRKFAFIIVIIGVAFLVGMLAWPAKYVGAESIESLEINKKVYFEGNVARERVYGDFRILDVDDVEVVCNCEESFVGERIGVIGLISEFKGNRQIRALKINVLR